MIRKFGLEFNKIRAKEGLPILKADWILVDTRDNYFRWIPPIKHDSMYFSSKLVDVRNGKIHREENRIIGSNKYQTVDGLFFEDLYISCVFNEDETPSYWDCEFRGNKHEYGLSITKSQADSIAMKWRIKL